jgi:hypothetical protein
MQFDLLNKALLKTRLQRINYFCSLSLISVAISPSAALSTACIDADQLPKLLPDLTFLNNTLQGSMVPILSSASSALCGSHCRSQNGVIVKSTSSFF